MHDRKPLKYEDLPRDHPLCVEALEHCPWRTTDHWPPETRGDNYCTWCDGFVTAAILYRDIVQTYGDRNVIGAIEGGLGG